MLSYKLWNNEFTENILYGMIKQSTSAYNEKISSGINTKDKQQSLLSFLSDDIYEFDTIARFSKVMIELGVNVQKWTNISLTIKKYNNSING